MTPAEYSSDYRRRNREAVNVGNAVYRAKLRAEMIAAYGGACTCCGEATPEFLTLEHKLGDGAEHRRQFSRSATSIYRDLKRQGWPSDRYTVLCMNCNFAGRFGKTCPHRRVAEAAA